MEKCETASTTSNSGTVNGAESGTNSNPNSNKTSARSSLNSKKRPEYLQPAISKEDEDNVSSLINAAEKTRNLSDLYKIGRDFGFLNVSLRRKAYMTILSITEDEIEEVQEALMTYQPTKRNDIICNDANRSLIGFSELASLPEESLAALRADLSLIMHYFFDTHPQYSYYQGMNNLAELFLILYGKATAYLLLERLTIRNMSQLLSDKGFSQHLSNMMQVCLKVLEKEVPEYKRVLGVEKIGYVLESTEDDDIEPEPTMQTEPEVSPGIRSNHSASEEDAMLHFEDGLDQFRGAGVPEGEEMSDPSNPALPTSNKNCMVESPQVSSRKTSAEELEVGKPSCPPGTRLVLKVIPMSKEEEEEATRSRLGFIVSWIVTWFSYKVKNLDTICRIIDFLITSPPYMASVMAALVVRQIISAHELVPGSPDEKIFLAFFGSDLDFISWHQVISQARILDQTEDYGSIEISKSSNPFSRLIGRIQWKVSKQNKLRQSPHEYYSQEIEKVDYRERTQSLQQQAESNSKGPEANRGAQKQEGFFKSVTRSIGMAFSSKKKPEQPGVKKTS